MIPLSTPQQPVSNYLHTREIGEALDFTHRTRNVKIRYPFKGVLCGLDFLGVRRLVHVDTVFLEPTVTHINLIAVGAGIAPHIQALQKMLETPGDTTQITLFYGNRTCEDVLMRERLERWAREHPHRAVWRSGHQIPWHSADLWPRVAESAAPHIALLYTPLAGYAWCTALGAGSRTFTWDSKRP